VRTITKSPKSKVTIHTKNLITLWETLTDQPPVEVSIDFPSMLMTISIDMINSKEFNCLFSTTSTYRRISTIVPEHFKLPFKTTFPVMTLAFSEVPFAECLFLTSLSLWRFAILIRQLNTKSLDTKQIFEGCDNV